MRKAGRGRHPSLPYRPLGKFLPTVFTSPSSSTHPSPASSIWPPARSQEQFHLAQILKEKQLFVPSTRGKGPQLLLQRHLFTCQGKEKQPLGLPNPEHPAEDKSCFSSGTTGGCKRQRQRPCQPSTPLTPPRGCLRLKDAAALLTEAVT